MCGKDRNYAKNIFERHTFDHPFPFIVPLFVPLLQVHIGWHCLVYGGDLVPGSINASR